MLLDSMVGGFNREGILLGERLGLYDGAVVGITVLGTRVLVGEADEGSAV